MIPAIVDDLVEAAKKHPTASTAEMATALAEVVAIFLASQKIDPELMFGAIADRVSLHKATLMRGPDEWLS